MKLLLLSFIILTLFSCGSFKKLEINEIRLAYVEYNPIEAINFGSIIEAKIMVIMNDGKEINITNNRKLKLNSNDVIAINSKQFKIIKHPKIFNQNTASLDIKIKDKDYIFETTDSIKINFKGDLNINANGIDGDNGIDQKHRNSLLIFRNGSNGEDGTNGADGEDAEDYSSKIWMEEGFTHVYIENKKNKEVWRYKTLNGGKITFNLEGGNGGNGGNGGSIEVIIHTNNSIIEPNLFILTNGGRAGNYGKAGIPGNPGIPIVGQLEGRVGRRGFIGKSGRKGLNGDIKPIQFKKFDVNQFK